MWALLRAARAASAAEEHGPLGGWQLPPSVGGGRTGPTVPSVPRPPCAAAAEVVAVPAAVEHAVAWLRSTPKLCDGVDALGFRLVLLRQALALVSTHGLGFGGGGGDARRRLEGGQVRPRHASMLDAEEAALSEAAQRVVAERVAAADETRREAAAAAAEAAAEAEAEAEAAGKPKPKGKQMPPPPLIDHGAAVWRSAFELSELVYSIQVEAEEGARLETAQADQLLYKLGPEESEAAAAAAEAEAEAAAAAAAEDPTEVQGTSLERPQARRPRGSSLERSPRERDTSPVTPRCTLASGGGSSVTSVASAAQSGQRRTGSSSKALWSTASSKVSKQVSCSTYLLLLLTTTLLSTTYFTHYLLVEGGS